MEFSLTKQDILQGLYYSSDEVVISLMNIVGFGNTTPAGKEQEVAALEAELIKLELEIKALESL